jgi:hypothetical protein
MLAPMRRQKTWAASSVLLACVLGGCSSVGPASVTRDRFDYVASMSDSWKRQSLVNLVKVRYADAPVFLDVDSVISAYTWETQVNLGVTGSASPTDPQVAVGGSGRYADQPTITYSPLSGAKFARSLLTPFSIPAIFALLQSGYRADLILRIGTISMNGLENAYGGIGSPRGGNTQFAEALEHLRVAQTEGRLDIRNEEAGEEGDAKHRTMLLIELRPSTDPAAIANDDRFRQLLGLEPGANEFEIVHGLFARSTRQIALVTRSMMEVLTDLASYVDVPRADVAEGRVYTPQRSADQLRTYPPLLHVYSGDAEPADAFSSVRYRKHWFWIDDRDVYSKEVFNFMLLLFSLTERGDPEARPLITVPAR